MNQKYQINKFAITDFEVSPRSSTLLKSEETRKIRRNEMILEAELYEEDLKSTNSSETTIPLFKRRVTNVEILSSHRAAKTRSMVTCHECGHVGAEVHRTCWKMNLKK